MHKLIKTGCHRDTDIKMSIITFIDLDTCIKVFGLIAKVKLEILISKKNMSQKIFRFFKYLF